MSWVITPQYLGAAVSDADAQAYLRAVETADNQGPLEQGVQQAVNQFVIGCKSDLIWTAIKACCILDGARTLAGALVPLVGTAPTNNNFVSGDYDRKAGLRGSRTAVKGLNTSRASNADPQNNNHISVYITSQGTISGGTQFLLTGRGGSDYTEVAFQNSTFTSRSRNITNYARSSISALGGSFLGNTRSVSSEFTTRSWGLNAITASTSATPTANNYLLFGNSAASSANSQIPFYSIGESLNLALLDARVTTLINAIAAAIP